MMGIATEGKTLDQRRAEHAWDAVEEVVQTLRPENAKKYGGQAKKLPMRIRTAGLGQSLAFLKAKKYAPELEKHLNDWVLQKHKGIKGNKSDLLDSIVKGDAAFLRRATDEVLSYLQWLNRFVDARGLGETEDEHS